MIVLISIALKKRGGGGQEIMPAVYNSVNGTNNIYKLKHYFHGQSTAQFTCTCSNERNPPS